MFLGDPVKVSCDWEGRNSTTTKDGKPQKRKPNRVISGRFAVGNGVLEPPKKLKPYEPINPLKKQLLITPNLRTSKAPKKEIAQRQIHVHVHVEGFGPRGLTAEGPRPGVADLRL